MPDGKKGFFGRLVSGLAKTRANIVAGMDSIFSGYSAIDDDFYEEIEEILIMGDIGFNATNAIKSDKNIIANIIVLFCISVNI